MKDSWSATGAPLQDRDQMKHKTMLFAAVLVVAIAAGSTGYALSDNSVTKPTGSMFSRSCAEQVAPQTGYKIVSFNPLTLKAIKANPWTLQNAVKVIQGLCNATVGSTPGSKTPSKVPANSAGQT